MVKVELGIKRVCCSCGTRFYDLNKMPPVCPKCNTEQPIELPRGRPPEEDEHINKNKELDHSIDTDDLDTDDTDVDDVIEDTSDLEDDVDAIGSEIEVIKDDDGDGDS
ncbi:TIGR02300 family protein [Commensalibacter oyaizuii]|uniref:TIGR02300 family protein n=1 Tax=Commensalibacter oyaizuii TaxID=3043873 RepID=A0ABT6PY67_9PROT|nr:TIGR02300 family protein [Commensalibacter sp. TBRC 16381]MDI2089809.1 TIGR02300 family protein [Commensalibacter sp. TBRC 16381]